MKEVQALTENPNSYIDHFDSLTKHLSQNQALILSLVVEDNFALYHKETLASLLWIIQDKLFKVEADSKRCFDCWKQ